MAQPTPYDRTFSFAGFQSGNPSSPLPGDRVDGEFDAVELTLDQVLANLVRIQRDDGGLANSVVTIDSLATDTLGFLAARGTFRGAWASGVGYSQQDLVSAEGQSWLCAAGHVSGIFDDDVTLGYWLVLGGVEGPPGPAGPAGPPGPAGELGLDFGHAGSVRWNVQADGTYVISQGLISLAGIGTAGGDQVIALPGVFSSAEDFRVQLTMKHGAPASLIPIFVSALGTGTFTVNNPNAGVVDYWWTVSNAEKNPV